MSWLIIGIIVVAFFCLMFFSIWREQEKLAGALNARPIRQKSCEVTTLVTEIIGEDLGVNPDLSLIHI